MATAMAVRTGPRPHSAVVAATGPVARWSSPTVTTTAMRTTTRTRTWTRAGTTGVLGGQRATAVTAAAVMPTDAGRAQAITEALAPQLPERRATPTAVAVRAVRLLRGPCVSHAPARPLMSVRQSGNGLAGAGGSARPGHRANQDGRRRHAPLVPHGPPGTWLAATRPWLAPYLPQIGDDVVYLHEGHRLFVQAHPVPPFTQALPWDVVGPSLRTVEWCHIAGASVDAPPRCRLPSR